MLLSALNSPFSIWLLSAIAVTFSGYIYVSARDAFTPSEPSASQTSRDF